MPELLIIDDDVSFCRLLERFLVQKSYGVQTAFSGGEALNKINNRHFDLVMTDLRLPDTDGLELLVKIKSKMPQTPVILMTGYSEVNTAVRAMKSGAFDYVSKPLNREEVLLIIEQALKTATESPKTQNTVPETAVVEPQLSEMSQKLYRHVAVVAPTDFSVLLTGESGTGKEVIARSIHRQSKRNHKPFVAVDCGAIPKEIAASEFFGHLKGSFTGALQDKTGFFEAAHGGTLFLDEIGNLSYENQIQLLRALQERKIKPVGSNREVEVDIRLITATNEDLKAAVAAGTFREDLYHRINEFSIHIPRLVDRKEDLLSFAEHFLEDANALLNKELIGFSDEVLHIFMNYTWPGNLRELRNIIKRAALLSNTGFIEAETLPADLHLPQTVRLTPDLKTAEKDHILQTLKAAGYNKTKASKLLNISRKTLYNKLKELGINAS